MKKRLGAGLVAKNEKLIPAGVGSSPMNKRNSGLEQGSSHKSKNDWSWELVADKRRGRLEIGSRRNWKKEEQEQLSLELLTKKKRKA